MKFWRRIVLTAEMPLPSFQMIINDHDVVLHHEDVKNLSVNNIFSIFASAAVKCDCCGGEMMQGEAVCGFLFIANLELAEVVEPAV